MDFTGSVRPIAVSAYRLICIYGRPGNMRPFSSTKSCLFHVLRDMILAAPSRPKVNHRELFNIPSYASFTKYDALVPMSLEPVIGSFLAYMDEEGYAKYNAPGLEKTESDDVLCVFVCMPRVTKKDHVKVCVEDNSWLLIEAEKDQVSYLGYMRLPSNVDKTSSDINGKMQDGMLKLTFPKLKDRELKTSDIFANFMPKLRLRYFGAYVAHKPFHRRKTLKKLCPNEFHSFTMYKEVTADSVDISLTLVPDYMELTREGACVSLNMPELKIEEVKQYFIDDILLIEGKTKTKMNKVHHYITGICMPESILKERNMIKTEMQDGMDKATLPYVTAEIKIN
ncbi:putative Heat shock protein HSP14.7/HSP23.5/HSP23.6 [Helianthus debilis subsp. tardiflorus]